MRRKKMLRRMTDYIQKDVITKIQIILLLFKRLVAKDRVKRRNQKKYITTLMYYSFYMRFNNVCLLNGYINKYI